MKVNNKEIYLDSEDEAIAVSIAIQILDKKFKDTSARWMWLPSVWGDYVVQKTALQKRLRKLQEN